MTDLLALLQALASEPAFVLVCAFCVFVAGVVAGVAAREARNDQAAADTAALRNAAGHESDQRIGSIHHAGEWPAPPAATPRPRVRAIGAPLKPSYDSRARAGREQNAAPRHQA